MSALDGSCYSSWPCIHPKNLRSLREVGVTVNGDDAGELGEAYGVEGENGPGAWLLTEWANYRGLWGLV